jgi:hypothetical protein
MKGVASFKSEEGTTVKLRAGAVTELNSSKEESPTDSFNATEINRMERSPRADELQASVFSAHPTLEHALCTARPQTSIVAMLTLAETPLTFTSTFTKLLSATNNGAALSTLTKGLMLAPLQSNCKGDPTIRNTKDVSIQPVWSHDIRTAPEKDRDTLEFRVQTANSLLAATHPAPTRNPTIAKNRPMPQAKRSWVPETLNTAALAP